MPLSFWVHDIMYSRKMTLANSFMVNLTKRLLFLPLSAVFRAWSRTILPCPVSFVDGQKPLFVKNDDAISPPGKLPILPILIMEQAPGEDSGSPAPVGNSRIIRQTGKRPTPSSSESCAGILALIRHRTRRVYSRGSPPVNFPRV